MTERVTPESKTETGPSAASKDAQAIEALVAAIARLKFGSVVVTIHDGRIVQLDVSERSRFI